MIDRVPTEAIVAAYDRLGSVWAVADELGISGQTVSRRMKAAGHPVNKRWITDAERSRIEQFYRETPPEVFDLDNLVEEIGRTKAVISREAARMGLTTYVRPLTASQAERAKIAQAGKWSRNPHPRGMAGKKHTPETLARVGEASKRNWSTWKTFGIGPGSPEGIAARRAHLTTIRGLVNPTNVYSRCRSGRRADLGDMFFRSSWEANYARYLNLLLSMGVVAEWAYEPQKFRFEGIKSGTTNYTPDFRVVYKGDTTPEFVELKGFTTPKDRTKWRRMKKYHPGIRLTVITSKEYYALARKWSSSIPNWESDKGGGRKIGPRVRRAA